MITESLKRDLEYTYNKLSKEEIERLSNSSVMITGCAGFLGYYFVHFLYAYKEKLNLKKVVCLDNFMLGYPKWLDKISEDERFAIKKFDIIKDKITDIEAEKIFDAIIVSKLLSLILKSPTLSKLFKLITSWAVSSSFSPKNSNIHSNKLSNSLSFGLPLIVSSKLFVSSILV